MAELFRLCRRRIKEHQETPVPCSAGNIKVKNHNLLVSTCYSWLILKNPLCNRREKSICDSEMINLLSEEMQESSQIRYGFRQRYR